MCTLGNVGEGCVQDSQASRGNLVEGGTFDMGLEERMEAGQGFSKSRHVDLGTWRSWSDKAKDSGQGSYGTSGQRN